MTYDQGSLGEHIQLTLSRAQILRLARILRRDMNKNIRKLAKRPLFVPEDGKINTTKLGIEHQEQLMAILLDAIGPGFDLEDGGRPRRRTLRDTQDQRTSSKDT